MGDIERCTAKVWRGPAFHERLEECGNRAKRDGLCGTHLNVRERAEADALAEHERSVLRARVLKCRPPGSNAHLSGYGSYEYIVVDVAWFLETFEGEADRG